MTTGNLLQALVANGCAVADDEPALQQVAWLMASILSRLGCLGDLPGEPLSDTELAVLRSQIQAGRRRIHIPTQRRHLTVVRRIDQNGA